MAEATETTTVAADSVVTVPDPKAAPDVESLNKRIAGQGRTIQELLEATGAKNVEEAKRMLKEHRKVAETKAKAEPEPVATDLEVPDRQDPKFFDADGNPKTAEFNRAHAAYTSQVARRDRERERDEENAAAVDVHLATEAAKLPETWHGEVEGWEGDEDVVTRVVRGLAHDMNGGKPPTAEYLAKARAVVEKLGEKIAKAIIAGQDAIAAENAEKRPPHPGRAKPANTTSSEKPTPPHPGATPEEMQGFMRQKLKASRET